jgi:integrase
MEPFPEVTWNENMLLPEVAKMKKVELLREGDLQFADTRAELIQFAIYLRKRGLKENTATGQSKLLRILWQRGAELYNPESVKETIANQESWCPGRKENAVDAYTNFLLMHNHTWNPPIYRRIEKIPFIPMEKEIDDLIAGCGKKTATFLQLLKETAIRAGEAWQMEWKDIDAETRIIRVKPEKGSNPRAPRISEKLMAMINTLEKKNSRIFGSYSLNGFAASYYMQRKRIALKLQNPRIQQITFHTFRHWKATMEYRRTKDILYIMKMLGHKNIKNTLIYTQLLPFQENDQFISKVAENTKAACQLIEDGWEYVTGEYSDGGKIFRKPK